MTRPSDGLANLTDDFDAVVAASRDTNADDEHDPEGATIAFERSQIGALVRQARHHLAEIDAAIERLDCRHLRRLRSAAAGRSATAGSRPGQWPARASSARRHVENPRAAPSPE